MEPISKIPWAYVIIACATLGLAPFTPPHIWEKLNMLINGTLKRPVDWFDLFFHGIPWILLVLKTIATIIKKGSIPGQ
ncbi:MAG: RND transporter [bacterium]|nr:RND transporter [bacterium]